MAKQTPPNKRSRIIAALSLLFSLIGLLFVIIAGFTDILADYNINIMFVGGVTFPLGAVAWLLAREVKSTILTILGVLVTFTAPIYLIVAVFWEAYVWTFYGSPFG
jgi:hypothetical protein